MATPTLSPSTVTIPSGGTADVTVSWSLDPGTATVNGTLTLSVDGGASFSVPVTHQGTPAETAPTLVTSNPQPGQALVTCDVATVTLVSQTQIRLS